MKRFYRLFISLLVIVGIVAVAPATTVETESKQCISTASSCGGDQVDFASLISRKRKRRVRNLKEKLEKVKKADGANGSPSGRRRKPVNSFHYLIKKALLAPFLFFRN